MDISFIKGHDFIFFGCLMVKGRSDFIIEFEPDEVLASMIFNLHHCCSDVNSGFSLVQPSIP